MAHVWNIHMIARTTHPDGSPRYINRDIEGAGDARAAMRASIARRKDAYLWYGVEITGETPLGQRIVFVYEPDARP